MSTKTMGIFFFSGQKKKINKKNDSYNGSMYVKSQGVFSFYASVGICEPLVVENCNNGESRLCDQS